MTNLGLAAFAVSVVCWVVAFHLAVVPILRDWWTRRMNRAAYAPPGPGKWGYAGETDPSAKLTDEIGGGSAGLVDASTGLRLRAEQTGGTVAR